MSVLLALVVLLAAILTGLLLKARREADEAIADAASWRRTAVAEDADRRNLLIAIRRFGIDARRDEAQGPYGWKIHRAGAESPEPPRPRGERRDDRPVLAHDSRGA